MHIPPLRHALGVVAAVATLAGAFGPWTPSALADGCTYVLGFQTLHAMAPTVVGRCADDQAYAANGNAIQYTTHGMLVWRKADNWTAFTNGYWTWINGPYGLVKRLNTERFWWEANPDHLLVIGPHGYITEPVSAAPAPPPPPLVTPSPSPSPSVTPAPAGYSIEWQAPVQGQPQVQAGSPVGFYVWHARAAGDAWRLVTTDPPGVRHIYSGTITTDGALVGVQGIALKRADSLQVTAPNTITFAFHTASGINGLQFSVRGGTQLTFNLSIDGQPAPTNQIFLGATSANPSGNVFTFTRAA